MKKLLKLIAMLAMGVCSQASLATNWVITSNTVTGINDLVVGATHLDVTFGDGTASRGLWTTGQPYFLNNQQGAIDALTAIKNWAPTASPEVLLSEIAAGISGASNASVASGFFNFLVPFYQNSQDADKTTYQLYYLDLVNDPTKLAKSIGEGPTFAMMESWGIETNIYNTWADFTPHTQVPEPETLLQLSLGIAGLMFARRRNIIQK